MAIFCHEQRVSHFQSYEISLLSPNLLLLFISQLLLLLTTGVEATQGHGGSVAGQGVGAALGCCLMGDAFRSWAMGFGAGRYAGKTIGKPWENCGLMGNSWDYPLTNMAMMGDTLFSSVIFLWKPPISSGCPIATFDYRRAPIYVRWDEAYLHVFRE